MAGVAVWVGSWPLDWAGVQSLTLGHTLTPVILHPVPCPSEGSRACVKSVRASPVQWPQFAFSDWPAVADVVMDNDMRKSGEVGKWRSGAAFKGSVELSTLPMRARRGSELSNITCGIHFLYSAI
jgi:hypothetical protein